jgi:hypothetical protein
MASVRSVTPSLIVAPADVQAMMTVVLGDPAATQQPPNPAQQQASAGVQPGSQLVCSSGAFNAADQSRLLLLRC